MFYVTAAVYSFGAIAYCFLASGSIQPWAIDEAAVSPGSDTNVVEVELNGTDTLLDPEKHSSSLVSKPALEHNRNDDATTDSLLQVSS